MTYELAKQLKDAGFLQDGDGSHSEGETDFFLDYEFKQKNVYYPTLSELIESCGEEFVLEKVNSGGLHQWTAGTFIDRNGEIECAQTGETSEEAVAKLYLALNKKQ